jgi:hypothetical protein
MGDGDARVIDLFVGRRECERRRDALGDGTILPSGGENAHGGQMCWEVDIVDLCVGRSDVEITIWEVEQRPLVVHLILPKGGNDR